MYISIIVTSGLGRAVVPWSILEIADEQKSFEDLFWSVQAGCFDVIPVSDELKRAQLIKTSVGTKADSLMIVSSSQTVSESWVHSQSTACPKCWSFDTV